MRTKISLVILLITLLTISSGNCATSKKAKKQKKGPSVLILRDAKNSIHIRIATHSSSRCAKFWKLKRKYKLVIPKAKRVTNFMKLVCSKAKVIPSRTLVYYDTGIKKTVVIQFKEEYWYKKNRLDARAKYIASIITVARAKKKERETKLAAEKKKAAEIIKKAEEAKKKAAYELKKWKIGVELFGHFATVVGENNGKLDLDHALIKGSVVISKNIKTSHNLTFKADALIKLQKDVDPETTASLTGEYRYFLNSHYSVLTIGKIGHDKPKNIEIDLYLVSGIEWNYFHYHKDEKNQFKISLLVGPRGKWEYDNKEGYGNLILSFRIKYQKPISKKVTIVLMAMMIQSLSNVRGDMNKPEFILSVKLQLKDIIKKNNFKLGMAIEATAKFYVRKDQYYSGEQGIGLSFNW